MNVFWSSIMSLVVGLAIGGGLGFFLTRSMMEKKTKEQLKKIVMATFRQSGQKPSEAKVRAIMNSIGK